MREEPVRTEREAEAARRKQGEEKRDLKPVEAEIPKVKRNRGESEKQSSAEERTGHPVDTIGR